jgi:hypothetical protein
MVISKNGKAPFILPYGALAASIGSASVPLRQLAGREVMLQLRGFKRQAEGNRQSDSENIV